MNEEVDTLETEVVLIFQATREKGQKVLNKYLQVQIECIKTK